MYKDRTQKLPIVKSVKIEDIEKVDVVSELDGNFENINECYKVSATWEYDEDLGYMDNASFLVVNDNDKLSIAKIYSEE